ncbi:type I-C CRISPR-associated protein Cas8c/Csd1 [Dokdonella soli]|uniref:Type I-C CRISPR-associated protein Cas8c/Csd1 n=1 Tax=Dokdonella soli TaxID=529810 RepID=A0ABN1IT64_9GAMM
MILQALCNYYERKSGSGELAPDGFESKEIPFVLVLDEAGGFVQIDDTRRIDGKKKATRAFLVTQAVKRSVGVAANLLWDTPEYVLGVMREGGKPKRVAEQHTAFKARLDALAHSEDAGLLAVRAFLAVLDLAPLQADPLWSELTGTNPFISFRLATDSSDTLVCQRSGVVDAIRSADAETSKEPGFCLVRGEADGIARLHPAIKNVWGAQTAGANIVSFNLAAFNSFGKEQSYNAPVGQRAAFAYTTALNHLLRKGSPQRMQVGDASTVFWAADVQHSDFQQDFAALFGETEKDDPDRGADAVRHLYRATETGVYINDDAPARFCVLGLAPNAARIAVRFWQIAPVGELALRIRAHFDDLDLAKPAFEKPYLSLFRLLTSIAVQNKAENVPPDLAGDTMRAILCGAPYPATLLQAAVRRIRAEQTVNYPRAAILKASLNRLIRHNRLSAKELSVSLDRNNTVPAYRLGRLFAALERIQGVAQPGINATIRERYYGAASSAPASVFPILLKLKNHHLAKIDKPGLVVWFEKLLGEIFGGLSAIPPRLSLTEQGVFAIGYYHQQQDFFASKSQPDATAATDATNQGEME